MKSIIVFLLCLVLSFSLGAGSIKPPKKFEGKLWASTLALYFINEDGANFDCTIQPYEKIAGGYRLLTAGHCVQLVPADVRFAVADDINGALAPVTLIKAYYGDNLDFATFEFKTTKFYAVTSLGDEHTASVGDLVISPNFGYGLGKQISEGRISSSSLPSTEACDATNCAGSFLVQMFGAAGASGAAVISATTHKMIGLTVGEWHGNVGMGVQPISSFKTFLAAPVQPHPTPSAEVDTPLEIIIQ